MTLLAAAAAGPDAPCARAVLGTMTLGGQIPASDVAAVLRGWAAAAPPGARVELDTARLYCCGETEQAIGAAFEADPSLRAAFIVATKVNPFPAPGGGESLARASVRAQFAASLAALRCRCGACPCACGLLHVSECTRRAA